MKTNKEDFDALLDERLSAYQVPFTSTKEEAWAKIYSRLHKADIIYMDSNASSKPWIRLAVAASVLVVALALTLTYIGGESMQTSGEMAEVILPDGSTVLLNQESSIEFNEMLWAFDREVELNKGQAFFKVKKGETFTVETDLGFVEVLGTSFDVEVDNNFLKVACKTGKVRVSDGNNDINLLPGDEIVLSNEGMEIAKVVPETIDSWTRGDYNFDNVAVRDVLEIVAEMKDMELDYSGGEDNLMYSGQFNINQPLEEILDIICLPVSLNYEIDTTEQKITITKN